jgi:GxxExxY protein
MMKELTAEGAEDLRRGHGAETILVEDGFDSNVLYRVKRENELSEKIIGAAIRVHRSLGPGLLESAYEQCLIYELRKSGLEVRNQVPMPLVYESVRLDVGYRIDLIVEDKVIVEVKSVEALNDVHVAQILTYLKLSELKLGLLINFNVPQLVKGVKRLVNGI